MLREEDVAYEVDGVAMVGALITDDEQAGPRPSVLVFGGGTGFAPFHRNRARRLGELGYLVFGADYFGGGRVLEGPAREAARAGMTPDRWRDVARGAFDALVTRPECDPTRVAALGYCFGGRMAVRLARTGADVKAVIGFHPGVDLASDPDENRKIAGSVLMCCGTADQLVPLQQVIPWLEQMTEVGADCTVELYAGAGHLFTDPDAHLAGLPGCSYDEKSDERSWASMLRRLSTTIG